MTIDNNAWMTTSGGPIAITMLEAPRVDTTLRKPYGHRATEQTVTGLVKLLRKCEDNRLQCSLVSYKSLAKGYKVSVFFLGFTPGLCGENSAAGMNEKEWDDHCSHVEKIIEQHIPNAITYKEPFTGNRKFQFRWEAYIQTRD
jgi:hypothetical protein